MLDEADEDKELVHTRQIICRGYRRKDGPVLAGEHPQLAGGDEPDKA